MSKLQLLHVFLNERLTAAVEEIVGAVEKTVVEYQEENDRLRRMLRITQEIPLCKIGSLPLSLAVSEEVLPEQQHCEQEWSPSLGQEDPKPTQIIEEQQIQGLEPDIEFKFTPSCVKNFLQLFLAVSEEEVPPEQQHCEQEWSPCLGQGDPEPTQIKEEQEELGTSQEEEQLQGLFDTKDSIFTPPCVKSECDQEDPLHKAILAEYPTLSRLKMSKLQSFRMFLNEHLTASASVEIFGAVEKTVVVYQEENDRLRRLLWITPEIKLCRIDSLQFSLAVSEDVSPELQHCEQDLSPSLGQEDPEPTRIKEEQDKLQGLFDTKDSIFSPPCVKIECDQEDPLWSLTVENRENNQNNASSHRSAISSDPVGLDSSPPLGEHFSKPSTTSRKTHHCRDCGEMFALKADLQRHGTLAKKRIREWCFCKKTDAT
ncbi:hypothetical protein J4Q44_G00056990 [Coregonus suidteri]|uniref:C2H2-type domain-containing protein n=1 Tax=Coregonus suidteri TaxID=861788 RepID=A0AAN8R0B1_9TELE